MITAGLTSKGRRESNQDSFYAGEINGIFVLAVADGMGGHAGGEIASGLVIDSVISAVRESSKDHSLKTILSLLFEKADNALSQKKQGNPQLEGMGSTLACLLAKEGRFVAGNLGDSRIYRITQTDTECLTKDHTMLQEYLDQFGEPAPEEMVRSGHVLTKVIDGSGDTPFLYPEDGEDCAPSQSDLFVVLSDGLISDKTSSLERMITEAAKQQRDPEKLSHYLVNQALERGSSDNCTVVVGLKDKREKEDSEPSGEDHYRTLRMEPEPQKRRGKMVLLLFISAIILAGLLLLYSYSNGFSDFRFTSIMPSEEQLGSTASPDSLFDASPWERGFSELSLSTPFYEGSKLIWYPSDFEDEMRYHLHLYQDEMLVYSDSTSGTSFVLSDDHGYESGPLLIELYTVWNDTIRKPNSYSTITITYQQRPEP